MPYGVLDPTTAAAAPASTLGAPLTSTGKTLAGMRTELQQMLMGRGDIAVERFTQWINDAYLDVVSSLQIDELQGSLSLSLVAGQALYLLPSNVGSTQEVSIVDATLPSGGVPLSKVDKSYYRALQDWSDRPRHFFREGQMLVVWPTPDKAYTATLDYRLRTDPLVNDTDSPLVPEEWHRAILLRARQMAFDDLGEFDKVIPAENSAVGTIRRRSDRSAEEDEGRVVGSSVPGRAPQGYTQPRKTLRQWDID